MARIADLLAEGRTLSFEFGPPRTPEGQRLLEKTLIELEPLQPSFVSVTYGAGGSTRDTTREIVEHIQRDTAMTPMPHLTCVAHTRGDIVDIVSHYRDAGLHNLLALAGDTPVDGGPYPTDFRYALELIELVRELGEFSIGVAAHPELHPRSGATATTTGGTWRPSCARPTSASPSSSSGRATTSPWSTSWPPSASPRRSSPASSPSPTPARSQRFATLAGAAFPTELGARLSAVADQPEEVRRIGVEVATNLTQELLDGGAPGIHFYTLNSARATKEIYANLGIGPAD